MVLRISAISPGAASVTPGQTGVPVRMTLSDTGGTAASVTTASPVRIHTEPGSSAVTKNVLRNPFVSCR